MSWLSSLFSSGKKERELLAQAQRQQAEQADQARQQQEALQRQLSDQAAAAQQSLAEQQAASLQAQKDAEETAYRASLTPADSEDARQAAERKTRRLLSARGYASTIARGTGDLGAAPVATRQLLGA